MGRHLEQLCRLLLICTVWVYVVTCVDDVNVPYDDIACTADTQPRVLTDYRGWFTSPNHPLPYPNQSNCRWLILSQEPDGIVRVDLGVIRVNALVDRITIYDGNTTESPLISIFDDTGFFNQNASNIRSSGSSILVVFSSLSSTVNPSGFNATYTSLLKELNDDPCYPITRPLVLAAGEGAFQSNGFPVSYWNAANCRWIIESQEQDSVAVLTLSFLRTETGYDFLNVYDGNSTNSPTIASISGRLGSSVPGPFRSTGRQMLVTFTSDSTITEEGFSAAFSSRSPTQCGTVLSPAPNTTVVGPGYDAMCYLDVDDTQFQSSSCYNLVKNLPGIGDADSLVDQGGNFGCFLSTRDDFVGAENACYDNYQWSITLENCLSCTKIFVCIRFP